MDTSVEEVAFVGRSNVNNGITARVKKIDGIEPYEKGNLTLALGGAYLGSCFVQPEDFYTSQNVVVLIPNKEMDFYAKQFIASAIFVESQNNYQAFIKELQNWISLYNANRELRDYDPKREVYMAEARRKTTLAERKEIVEYCITHNRDYKGTASLYDVSYSQVYSWVRKYDITGEDGLSDKRGRHKTDDEVDELERLRRENMRLKRQLEEKDMMVELLKKVKEFEGM